MVQSSTQQEYPKAIRFEDLFSEFQQEFRGGDNDREDRIQYLKKAVMPLIVLGQMNTNPKSESGKSEFVKLVDKAVGGSSYASFTKKAGIDQGNFSKIRREKIVPSIAILLKIAFFADPKSGVTFEQLLNNAGYSFKSSDHTVKLEKPYLVDHLGPYNHIADGQRSDVATIRMRLIEAIAHKELVKIVSEKEKGVTDDEFFDFVLKTESFPNGWAFYIFAQEVTLIDNTVNECLIRSITGNYDKISIVVISQVEFDIAKSPRINISEQFKVSVILCDSVTIKEAVLGPNKHLLRL